MVFVIYYPQITDIKSKHWNKKVRVDALREVKGVISMPGTGAEASLAIANIINNHLAQILQPSLNINLCGKFTMLF